MQASIHHIRVSNSNLFLNIFRLVMFDIVKSGNMYKRVIFHQKKYVVVIDNLCHNVFSIKRIYHVHV